jgi:hypothetical protein
MVFQAGGPNVAVSALAASGRWEAWNALLPWCVFYSLITLVSARWPDEGV